MTRRQLFKNFGFGLAGLLALPLLGKPGKASEPVRPVGPFDYNTVGFSQLRTASGELLPVMVADATFSQQNYAIQYGNWHGSADGYKMYLREVQARQQLANAF